MKKLILFESILILFFIFAWNVSKAEEVPLYCELKRFEYKMDKDDDELTVDRYAPGRTSFFYFDTESKNIIWEIGSAEKKFAFKKEYKKSYYAEFRTFDFPNYFESIDIDKKSHRIYLKGHENNKVESIRRYECVIKTRIL